jgi:hypothetical protein
MNCSTMRSHLMKKTMSFLLRLLVHRHHLHHLYA